MPHCRRHPRPRLRSGRERARLRVVALCALRRPLVRLWRASFVFLANSVSLIRRLPARRPPARYFFPVAIASHPFACCITCVHATWCVSCGTCEMAVGAAPDASCRGCTFPACFVPPRASVGGLHVLARFKSSPLATTTSGQRSSPPLRSSFLSSSTTRHRFAMLHRHREGNNERVIVRTPPRRRRTTQGGGYRRTPRGPSLAPASSPSSTQR